MPNGTYVATNAEAQTVPFGALLPFTGDLYETSEGEVIGYGHEMCTQLSNEFWDCRGVYRNLYGCEGDILFAGMYEESKGVGVYPVTGGSGVFAGTLGVIYEAYDDITGDSIRTIHFGKGLM